MWLRFCTTSHFFSAVLFSGVSIPCVIIVHLVGFQVIFIVFICTCVMSAVRLLYVLLHSGQLAVVLAIRMFLSLRARDMCLAIACCGVFSAPTLFYAALPYLCTPFVCCAHFFVCPIISHSVGLLSLVSSVLSCGAFF